MNALYHMSMHMIKVVVTVPIAHADRVRRAIGEAGGGRLGQYSLCSFSTRGIGRFLPEEGATPAIGEIGALAEVDEESIAFVCAEELLSAVVEAIKRVHPYEVPAIDTWPVEIH